MQPLERCHLSLLLLPYLSLLLLLPLQLLRLPSALCYRRRLSPLLHGSFFAPMLRRLALPLSLRHHVTLARPLHRGRSIVRGIDGACRLRPQCLLLHALAISRCVAPCRHRPLSLQHFGSCTCLPCNNCRCRRRLSSHVITRSRASLLSTCGGPSAPNRRAIWCARPHTRTRSSAGLVLPLRHRLSILLLRALALPYLIPAALPARMPCAASRVQSLRVRLGACVGPPWG